MKPILLSILSLLFFTSLKAQSSLPETKEWNDLITSLQNEDWQSANNLTIICLKKIPANQQNDPDAALLRYMFIYSESGLMNLGKVSKDEALKSVVGFIGQVIILPGHPLTLKFAFNSVELVNNKTDSLHITATNQKATDIFSFEYVILKDKWPIDDFTNNIGKMYQLAGKLKKITVEGNFLPRFRIIIDNATYSPVEN